MHVCLMMELRTGRAAAGSFPLSPAEIHFGLGAATTFSNFNHPPRPLPSAAPQFEEPTRGHHRVWLVMKKEVLCCIYWA